MFQQFLAIGTLIFSLSVIGIAQLHISQNKTFLADIANTQKQVSIQMYTLLLRPVFPDIREIHLITSTKLPKGHVPFMIYTGQNEIFFVDQITPSMLCQNCNLFTFLMIVNSAGQVWKIHPLNRLMSGSAIIDLSPFLQQIIKKSVENNLLLGQDIFTNKSLSIYYELLLEPVRESFRIFKEYRNV